MNLTIEDLMDKPNYSFAYFVWAIDSVVHSSLSNEEKLKNIENNVRYIKWLMWID